MERWRTINGFGRYEVSDRGRVRNKRPCLVTPIQNSCPVKGKVDASS